MQGGRRTLGVLVAALVVLAVDLIVVADRDGRHAFDGKVAATASGFATPMAPVALDSPLPPPLPLPKVELEAAPPSTEAPVTTTTTAAPTTITTAAPARPGAWTLGPYQGLGVWLDVYDWTNEITSGRPGVQVDDIDRMADLGIQTIYIQTSHRRSAADVIEPERLLPMIERAHARGIAVVAWYLPTFENTDVDLRRLLAAAALPVDGLGVDIESLHPGDPVDRTRRLLELSYGLRAAMGTRAISAITPDAVHLQVVNPRFWPGFPWAELGATYDVIVPMAYWSVRKAEWRQGELYITENIDRIRAATGRPDMPIHIAGGIANGISLDDVAGMVHAIHMRGAIGGSLYDWNTSQAAQWDLLRALRVG